ncbi:hypothetical protein CTI12_AA271200 [Artemisia annua]|uniref:Uncharacterized protein n=1 Tax=Artemisia annua TaxID=35608 RepID=A0A2U1NFF3_ARTAN|nr:hypothetical protein CTI12_AA271200 [Artemisia annua]
MVSFISTASSYHHFISPIITPPPLNIAPISHLGFKQISTTPKIVVTNNNKTSTSGSGSGFSLSKEEEELERQIYEFMKNSNTPNDFPTKKQLLDAGRLDLVTAISNTGGWLAFGWDDDLDPPHPHFDTTSSL